MISPLALKLIQHSNSVRKYLAAEVNMTTRKFELKVREITSGYNEFR